ncbi:MAG: CBS domain-containing protein [Actinobacteria bacterium]|nr:CBS domain-containing protein [Actinomycetota bacterium]
MTTVRERMTSHPVICESSDTLADAARKMRDDDIGNVLVRIDGSFGIVTDRDIVVRAIAEGIEPESGTLGDIVSRDLEIAQPDDDLDKVVGKMRERKVRRIPVCENDQPVGILSIGDLAVMRDQRSALADISAAEGNR